MPRTAKSLPLVKDALGDWHTPVQRYNAAQYVWARFTVEEFDPKAFKELPDITYYNRPFKQDTQCEYDIRFNFSLDFDPKAHRDDRHNLDVVRNNVFNEERQRIIPVVSSQIYGHRRYSLEGHTLVSHKRMKVMEEILRRFRINVKPSKKLPSAFEYDQL